MTATSHARRTPEIGVVASYLRELRRHSRLSKDRARAAPKPVALRPPGGDTNRDRRAP